MSGYRSGTIAVFGRPNVGKSTLINRLLGHKLLITSAKPQTTRHRILGIKTTAATQFLYLDTPGLVWGGKGALARQMDGAAASAIAEADCLVLVAACPRLQDDDERALDFVKDLRKDRPLILALNKVDRMEHKETLLPLMEGLAQRGIGDEIIPLSARDGSNVLALEAVIARRLPEQDALYPEDQLSDRGDRFVAAEFVREQVFRRFAKEIPYVTTVDIESFREEKNIVRIEAVIYVEKEGQKAILVGQGGAGLKMVGSAARRALERHLQRKVYLGLWVKVRKGWSDDARALQSLGYGGDN
ncbi:GTPase Era [Acidiferrobacter sp.]|uniref:GTPase Era n=1 Tax=Acidiferrobacter sp. TaxID=1872107 RepID=UPI002611E1FD|nr:GTPase Era [Acidiferrobacter sp.]